MPKKNFGFWAEQMNSAIAEAEAAIQNAEKLHGRDRMKALNDIDGIIQKINQKKKGLQTEIRLLSFDDQRRVKYSVEIENCEKTVETLLTNITWLKEESDTSYLTGGKSAATKKNLTNKDVLNKIDDLQDKQEAMLEEGLEMVNNMNRQADDQNRELSDQADKINAITEKTREIDDNLSRADALIRSFARRMASDRFIQIFFVLNFLCLAAIIIYYAVKSGKVTKADVEETTGVNL